MPKVGWPWAMMARKVTSSRVFRNSAEEIGAMMSPARAGLGPPAPRRHLEVQPAGADQVVQGFPTAAEPDGAAMAPPTIDREQPLSVRGGQEIHQGRPFLGRQACRPRPGRPR